jgi:hypothetical protein
MTNSKIYTYLLIPKIVFFDKMPAGNERFYESGDVCPQKHLCEFASASLARTFVNPRLHKAAKRYLQAWRQRGGQ